jgi:hypothetical protein
MRRKAGFSRMVWHERFRCLKARPKDVDLVPGFTGDVTGLVSD